MKKEFKVLSTFLCCCILAGACSSSVKIVEKNENNKTISLTAHTKAQRTLTKDLTLEDTKTVRSGAAYSQGSYKHVLAFDEQYADKGSPMVLDNVKYDRRLYGTLYADANAKLLNRYNTNGSYSTDGTYSTNASESDNKAHKRKHFTPIDSPYYGVFEHLGSGSTVDYSMYEMSRWERFCNNGLKMDGRDWKFVIEHKNSFPVELKGKCVPPSHRDLLKHRFFGS